MLLAHFEEPGAAHDLQQAVQNGQSYQPLYVKIKLIFGCNLRCAMCNHWREERSTPLPAEKLQAVFKELASLGCLKIHLTGGEPFLRPDTLDLVEAAVNLGLRVAMTSNATLLDKEKARRLARSGLNTLNISLDSPDRKTHDQQRGMHGAWKLTSRAVEYLVRFRKKDKPLLRINTVVTRQNYLSLASLPDFAHSLGVDAINLIAVDDHCGPHLMLRKDDIARYNQDIAPHIAERALELGLIEQPTQAYPFGQGPLAIRRAHRGRYAQGYYKQRPCFVPWLHSLIDFDGKVYPCCMTREQIPPLGDINKNSFSDIWQGALYTQLRQRMLPPSLAACERCDDFIQSNQAILDTLLHAQNP
jgi:MoaA/NifB/PqqE/SkfB family radical SAM enzyme